MDDILECLKFTAAVLGGVFGWIIGGFDSLFYALMVFIAIDYITGVMLAVINKKISSEIGFKGIFKKVMIFALVALGSIIDQYIIGSGSTLRTMLIMFYLSNEGISILENAIRIGLPLPQRLKDMLQQISSENNK